MLEQSAHRMALQVVPCLWAYIARTMVLTYWTFLVLRHIVEWRRTEKCDLCSLAIGVFYMPFKITAYFDVEYPAGPLLL